MENIFIKLKETLLSFENAYNAFSESEINILPFKGSWTVGQLAQHVILANGGFSGALKENVGETDRPIDQFLEILESNLLNFDIKMDAPDFVVPEIKEYEKNVQASQLDAVKNDILNGIEGLDLSKTCLAFELPVIGHVTRLEAINFVIFHTQRHTQQLNNIYQKLTKS